jgi:hypothetical protein
MENRKDAPAAALAASTTPTLAPASSGTGFGVLVGVPRLRTTIATSAAVAAKATVAVAL